MDRSNITEAGLSFPSDITKGIYQSKGGKVAVPNRVLTTNMVINKLEIDNNIQEWIKDYDFHYASLQIGINPYEGYMPEIVFIQGETNPDLAKEDRPMIKHVFPNTSFSNKNYSIESQIIASANFGFDQLQNLGNSIGGGLKGQAKITFNYLPTIPVIDSSSNDDIFHWNFRKNGNKIPIGGLDLHMIIARPRKTLDMTIRWSIKVKFKKKYLGQDIATAPSMMTTLLLKESQID